MKDLTLRLALVTWTLAAVLSPLTVSIAAAQEETESIQKFVARKDNWSALTGARFVLEGRIGVVSPQTIQFERCDLTFRLKSGAPTLPRETRVAEVTGTIVREGSRLYFDVDSIRRRDSDVETLRARRGRLESSRPEAWYGLADWAAGRAEFYQDSELRMKAEELREIGLTAELRRLKSDDTAGHLALAKRASDWNLDQGIGWKFIHDACRHELNKARRDPANDGSYVLTLVQKNLPGASSPLKKEDEPLRQAYDTNPAETYSRADTDTRFKLHRALFVQVLRALIEKNADPDGKNGYAIAARISQQIPELEELADSYRKKELTSLKSRVISLSRDELLDYSKKLTDRKQEADAKQAKQDWLRSREPGARVAGPRARMQLAEDYLQLLGDEKTARALYESAWNANPQSPEAIEWLTAHGLMLDNGRWVAGTASAKSSEDRFAQAIQEGQVLPGMSGEQARAAMGARPASVVRQASRGKVTELWIYKTEGLVVTLTRGKDETVPRVEDVASIADEVP
ncbi:MAG TPA: hypothetical protein VM452_14900 [Caulifigura sp.]|jgi:hypothetical protein|nr:hypothetical protein [Caulifigura sp.]